MATTANQIIDIEAKDSIEDSYLVFGQYVNTTRAVVGLDGLKSVQRRTLLAVRDEASTQWTGSANIVGRTTAKYHPHGSTESTVNRLVNEGYIQGHGNFGGDSILPEELGAAAMRYTKVKAHDGFNNSVFRLIKYVPTYENEFGVPEPLYLPVPIPLALTTGSTGIGIGLLSSIPAFRADSIFEALLADDPSKLKAPDGSFITSSDLLDIWNFGEGWVEYSYKVYQVYSDFDGKNVTVIEGRNPLFTPKVLEEFAPEFDEELAYYRVDSKRAITISRVKGIKRITDEEIYERATKIAKKSMFFRLYVSTGERAVRISLRDWLKTTWKLYEDAFTRWQTETLEDLEHKIKVYNLIPIVSPMIIKGDPIEIIAASVSEDVEIIKEIESKPIRYLRKADFSSAVAGFQAQIVDVKSKTAKEFGKDFVDILTKAQAAK